jgi:hypothetical protein
MPYDKEVLEKAKKIGFFERKPDAEYLKVDERERQKLAEKLKKATSSTSVAPNTTISGGIEVVELPVRNNEILNVQLTFWDRLIMFIISLLGLGTQEEYKKNKALKMIEQRLKRSKPVMVDFSRRYLSGNFGKVILSLYDQAKVLRTIFDIFLNNENIWKGVGVEKSSCEYLFETITNLESVVEDYKNLNQNIRSIVGKTNSLKTALKIAEDEISRVLKAIPQELVQRANNIFNTLMKFREFAFFDFETIVRKFTLSSELKGGSISFKPVSPQGLINHLKDLESILLSLELDNLYVYEYIKLMVNYVELFTPSAKEMGEIKQKINEEFFNSLRDKINKLMITDVISVIANDPTHKPFVIKTSYSLFNEFTNVLMDKYKRIIVTLMEEKNSKLIEKYLTMMFGKPIEIPEFGIYSTNVSKLFSKYGLPMFLYSKAVGVTSLFVKEVWESYLATTLNTLIVSGNFSEKSLQKTLSELYAKVEPVVAKMNSFIKAVEQGGEYHVLLSRFISNPSLMLNESNKKIIERKVLIINSVAYEFLEAMRDIFSGIHKILSFVVEDIYAPFPKVVVNIHKIGGMSNRNLIENLEKSVEKLNGYVSILKLFIEE